MIDMSNVFENLLTMTIILSLLIIVYCKIQDKTLGEIIIDVKEAMAVENE